MLTTAASGVYADRVPTKNARVVTLLRDAGAVFLGSGGANVWAALGTDTAASIRVPAAYCGVVGFKATYGLASIRGIVPVSKTHDHVGPLARSVADCALVMTALTGFDPLDPAIIDVPRADFSDAIDASRRSVSAPKTVLDQSGLSNLAGSGHHTRMTKAVTIDVSNVASRAELHALLAESLAFPSFYGKSWDAFWDSITGLVEMPEVLEFRGIENLKRDLPEEAAQLMTCLKDLADDYPKIHCEIRYIP